MMAPKKKPEDKFDSRLAQMFNKDLLNTLTPPELVLLEYFYGFRDKTSLDRKVPPAGSSERTALWEGVQRKLVKGRGDGGGS